MAASEAHRATSSLPCNGRDAGGRQATHYNSKLLRTRTREPGCLRQQAGLLGADTPFGILVGRIARRLGVGELPAGA